MKQANREPYDILYARLSQEDEREGESNSIQNQRMILDVYKRQVQGDPGEGKTTFVLAVISALTRGEPLPECEQAPEPVNVIYQTAEDGLADTIKPRLEAAGADCALSLIHISVFQIDLPIHGLYCSQRTC